eukprot:SAG11_NODE_61_length_19011_cov_49.624048_10_plen_183_part_00
MGYRVEPAYVAGVMEAFGQSVVRCVVTDAPGFAPSRPGRSRHACAMYQDGVRGIGFEDFQFLWNHLQGNAEIETAPAKVARAADQDGTGDGDAPFADAADLLLRQQFEKYDTNGDNVLDKQEVAAMMASLCFKVDQVSLCIGSSRKSSFFTRCLPNHATRSASRVWNFVMPTQQVLFFINRP